MRACGAGLRNAEDIRLRRDSGAAGIIRIRLSVAFHNCEEASGVPSCKVAFCKGGGMRRCAKTGMVRNKFSVFRQLISFPSMGGVCYGKRNHVPVRSCFYAARIVVGCEFCLCGGIQVEQR